MRASRLLLPALLLALVSTAAAAQRPEDTEQWTPVPRVVTPGKRASAAPDAPPSDAIVLFDGRNLDEWTSVDSGGPEIGRASCRERV